LGPDEIENNVRGFRPALRARKFELITFTRPKKYRDLKGTAA